MHHLRLLWPHAADPTARAHPTPRRFCVPGAQWCPQSIHHNPCIPTRPCPPTHHNGHHRTPTRSPRPPVCARVCVCARGVYHRYKYVNLDCGWMGGRHPNGTLFENHAKFPAGLKALADWLHARGLLLGACVSAPWPRPTPQPALRARHPPVPRTSMMLAWASSDCAVWSRARPLQ